MVTKNSFSRPYMWSVIGAAILICAQTIYKLAHDTAALDWTLLLVFAASVAFGRWLIIKIPNGNAEISIVDSIIFLTMLLYSGEAAIMLAVAESLFERVRFNNKPITILMSGATMACSTFVTLRVVELFFGRPEQIARTASTLLFTTAACVIALAQYLSNSIIVAVAVALRNNKRFWHTWSHYYLWTSITFFATAAAAAVTAKLVLAFGFPGVVIIVPIITSLYFTYRMYLKNVAASVHQAEQAERHVALLSHYVTELQQVEQALSKSEKDYRGLFENAHDAIMIVAPDSEIILEVNQRACEMYGFEHEEFVGLPLELISRDHASRRSTIQVVLKQKRSIRFETVHHRKDGSKMYLDIIASVVEYKDRRAILAINRDITERRELEAQLRQAQKMESIGTLAGGIAHDFNNLMAAVTGYSTMLLMDLDEEHPFREDIEEIKKAADRAASLTRQLLAFSRKQMLQPRVLNLNAVVTDVSKMLGRLIGENIRLTTDLDPALWQVEVDPAQIEQVLINLTVNARDAMPQGGTVTITTVNMQLDSTYCRHLGLPPDDYVLLTVSDTGCGMDDVTQARIFEPFYTTKEVGKGTGLGLSTVHGIVKQSGGEIEVQSAPGRGAHFRIYLPRSRGEDEMGLNDEEARAEESLGLTNTALLVEDEPVVRRMAEKMLQRLNFKVLVADHPDQALRIAADFKGQIQLMLTDVVMPKMSGSELADALRPSRPDMTVLYMSGYTEDAIIQHGVRSEGIHFIQKPFTPGELTKKIREVLQGALVEVM